MTKLYKAKGKGNKLYMVTVMKDYRLLLRSLDDRGWVSDSKIVTFEEFQKNYVRVIPTEETELGIVKDYYTKAITQTDL